MTTDPTGFWAIFLTVLLALISAVATYLKQLTTDNTLKTLEVKVDGKLSLLLETLAKAEFAKGVLAQRQATEAARVIPGNIDSPKVGPDPGFVAAATAPARSEGSPKS